MNKGLEALNRIGNMPTQNNIGLVMINTLRDYTIIEKELKVLEIIKKKEVNLAWLTYVDNVGSYNKGSFIGSYLTQEEYGLLKEVLL